MKAPTETLPSAGLQHIIIGLRILGGLSFTHRRYIKELIQ